MKCPQCEFENRPQAKFCEECASPLPRICANCGTQLSLQQKFCPECAHPVTDLPSTHHGLLHRNPTLPRILPRRVSLLRARSKVSASR